MLDNVVEHIRESFYLLQLWRRCYREIPTSLASFDAIQKYVMCNTLPLHKTGNGMQGILSLDIHKSKDIIATGCADGNTVSNQVSGNFIFSLEAHSKQVTCLKFVEKGELLVTGSADSTVRVWKQSDDGIYNFKHMLDDHTAEGACVTGSEQFLTAVFHPDGHIIGTGTSKFVRFWDVAKQDDIINIDAHSGPVTSIAFSENGFHLETAAEDGVKLWDLRFLRTFMTFPSDGKAHKCPGVFGKCR